MFDNLEIFSDNIAICDKYRNYTYKDVLEISAKLVENISSRSVCALICDNMLECICFYIGCIRKKIVLLMLPPNMGETAILEYIDRYDVKYLLSNKQLDIIESYSNSIIGFHKTLLYEFSNEMYEVNDSLALLLTTSGSSGNSKFVKLSYNNLYSNTIDIIKALPIVESDIVITTMPFSYSYGLSIINTHIFMGATIVLNQYSVYEKEFKKLLIRNKVNTFGGVPLTYELIDRFNILDDNSLKLKYITQAGGACNINLLKKIKSFGEKQNIEVYIMYGQTEATARISILPSKELDECIGSVGYAMDSGEILIKKNEMYIHNMPGHQGEIVYKGPNVMIGYATGKADLNIEKNIEELHTGDIGYLDNKGRLYIIGRTSRFLKINGNRISLDSIEKYFINKGIENICIYKDEIIIIISKIDINKYIKELLLEFSIKHWNVKNVMVTDFKYNQNNKIDYNWYINNL